VQSPGVEENKKEWRLATDYQPDPPKDIKTAVVLHPDRH
jgi:hypothetical protein